MSVGDLGGARFVTMALRNFAANKVLSERHMHAYFLLTYIDKTSVWNLYSLSV
jgi:hypothetical protein